MNQIQNTIYLVVSIMVFSSAGYAKEAKTTMKEQPREVASLSSPEQLAQKYLSIAHELAEVRLNDKKNGEICDYNAFQSEIYEVFLKARLYNYEIKPTAAISNALSNSLAFRVITAAPGTDIFNTNQSHPSFLVNTKFYARAQGAYGYQSYFELGPQGTGTYKIMEHFEEEPYTRWKEKKLTWKYIYSKNGPTLTFTIQGKAPADQKTLSYRISGYNSVPDLNNALMKGSTDKKRRSNGIPDYKTSYDDFEFLTFINGECEA